MKTNNIFFAIKILLLFCFIAGYSFVPLSGQNLLIDNTTFTTGQHLYYSPGTITSSDSCNKPVLVTGDAQVEYKAAQYIHLGGDFSTSLSSGCGTFHAYTGSQPTDCPTPVITGLTTVCAGLAATIYSVAYVPDHSYNWSVIGGTITAGQDTNVITIIWNTPGMGTVDVTESSSNPVCSTAALPLSITINPFPATTFSYLGTPYCSDETDPLPALNGEAGVFSATPAGLIINPVTGEVDLSASTAGTYTVTNTIAASGGCAEVVATTVITINESPSPVVITPSTTALCSYVVQALVATGGYMSGVFTPIIWTPITGLYYDAGATIPYTFTPTSSVYAKPNVTTIYTATAMANNGCITSGTSTITVSQPLTPTFTQLGPYSQNGIPGTLQLISLNGITGTWSPATINTTAAGTIVYTFTPTAGLCASPATMSVVITAPISAVAISQDIGTAVLAYWPAVSGTSIYTLQYRPFAITVPWIGISSNTNFVKIGNLTPGQHYECRVKAYSSSGSPLPGLQTGDFTTTPCTYVKDYDMGSTLRVGWVDYSPWASSYVFQYKKKVGGTSWLNNSCYLPYYNINTEPGVSYVCQVVVYKGGALWGTANAGEFTADSYNSSFAVSNGGTVVDLTWTDFNLNDPSSPWVVSQYLRYRLAGSSGPWIQKYFAGGTYTAHLTGLTPNTNNEFKVYVYLPSYWGSTPLGYFNTGVAKEMNVDNTDNNINIYPNPFTDQVIMEMFTEQEAQVLWNIYDMTGKIVMTGTENISTGYSTINIEGKILPKGVYMLNAFMNDQMRSFRIFKQ